MSAPLLRSLVCALALFSAGSAGAVETMKEIFSRVTAAYGKTAPAAVVETGTTTSFRRGEGKLRRLYKAPDRFLIEIRYATGSEVRAVAGKEAWQQGMLASQASANDLGPVATDGKTLRAIEIPLEDQLKLVVEIDPETGHILRSRGIQSMGDSTMEFATAYSDFRKTDGRLHATREEHFAMGQHIGYSVIEKVEYPRTIPEDVFKR